MLAGVREHCAIRAVLPGRAAGGTAHIVFGVDQRFARHAMVTLLSVLEANPGHAFHFHFISFDRLCLCAEAAVALVAQPRCALTTYQVPVGALAELPESPYFPKAACLRLLAPHLVTGCETLLYLDADIVCLAPATALWPVLGNTGAAAAVVADCAQTARRQALALGLKHGRYFNSGMLYIHILRWQKQGITEQVLEVLKAQGGRLRFPDQDALNQVLEGKCHYLPERYNQQFTLAHTRAEEVRPVPEGTVFLHYSGVDKPWQAWNEQAATVHYRRLRARLPWAGEPWDAPCTARQARRLYKLHFRRGRWLKGCFWLVMRWKAARRRASG